MERWLVGLVPALAAVQHRRVGGDDASHFVAEVHGDRREDVVARAAPNEHVDDGAVRVVDGLAPARRPTDDLEVVVVAVADDVAPRVG